MSFHKCRLCLKIGDFCSIFEKDDTTRLSDMVMSFADVKIYEGDGFSDRVCTACIENLSTAYLFKQQCERIDSLLRKYPEIEIDKSAITDYNEFCEKEFHMHSESTPSFHSIKSDNDENSFKDCNASQNSTYYETSDETDSDIDSIKCVYCSQSYGNYGAHTCHVTCTIENNQLQRSMHTGSNETLVASDYNQPITQIQIQSSVQIPEYVRVSCVLCDEMFDQYDDYVIHLNKCTTNVKLHHFVCPVCHELFTAKLAYLEHLKLVHYKADKNVSDVGVDCVDFAPMIHKMSKPKAVRRQIGWSIEDIYQEIECKKVEEKPTATSSPFKNFFSKLGNESFSRQSTPKKVSFRKFIENGKAKTSVYLPFRKYIQNYKQKKKGANYSPINSKMEVTGRIQTTYPETVSDSDYNSPSGTSEDSWKMKQNLICACDKKIFMLSEFINDRDRITAMINELGGVVAENTKMEMLATHFISVLPNDTFTGMMVCSLATGKWLLNISFIYDSFRCKKFLQENMYEWLKSPKIVEIDNTSVEVAKAAVYWHMELQKNHSKFPFEGKQIVLIMKKKYRQYYQMVFKALKAKPVTYDPRTPGSCCSADYCFVDMKIIERVKLRFFFHHNVPVFPYQYILVYLLKRGRVDDEHKYLLQDCRHLHVVMVGNRAVWQSPWVNEVYAVMAITSNEYVTMQGYGVPVSASGQSEKAGSQASSSNDCSSPVVGNLATEEYTVTGSNRGSLSVKTTKVSEKSKRKPVKRPSKPSSEKLEERKEKRRLYMRNYRAQQSKEGKKARLKQMRQHKAEKRISESDQARGARLQQLRQHKAEKRTSESDQAREARLQQMRQHKAEKRTSESDQAREARLQQMRQHKAEKRISESNQAREARLQQMRQHKAEKRTSESDQAREARLQQMRQHKAEKRTSESDQAREARLQQMRQHKDKKRTSESDQAREARLQQMRQHKAEKRTSESDQAREARLQQMRQHKAEKRTLKSDQAREARLQQMRQHKAEKRTLFLK